MDDRNDLPPNVSDHDLLIVLHTSMRHMSSDIKEIKDNNTRRLAVLEATKYDKEDAARAIAAADKLHEDHETRIRRTERWGFISIGALAVIQVLISIFK